MNSEKSKFYFLILFGAVLLLFFGCTDKDNYEVVPSEKILPKAKGNYNYTEDTIKTDTLKLSEVEQRLKDSIPIIIFSKDSVLDIKNTRLMPNQLGYKEEGETYFTIDSIPYHFVEWTFSDSSKTVNAFYNWLDCFGNDCRSIRIDEEKNGCKQAFVIWVSNIKISYLESSKRIELKRWEDLLIEKKGAWNYIIQQAPNSKIVWLESSTKNL